NATETNLGDEVSRAGAERQNERVAEGHHHGEREAQAAGHAIGGLGRPSVFECGIFAADGCCSVHCPPQPPAHMGFAQWLRVRQGESMTEVVGSIKPFMRASVAQQSSAHTWRYRCFSVGSDALDGDF